jgi:hypothetical protein
MCYYVPISLSAEDKAAARKIAGFMIPVYASILLAIVALMALGPGPRQGELVAAAAAPAALGPKR